jgi:hypothetical protein
MSSCLNSWGDWGRAKNDPPWMREGTRKSRAPSGVERVRVGVSTSTNPWASIAVRTADTSLARVTRLAAMTGRRRSR